jgi:flavin-dependent dehydrogenase
MTPCDVVIIGGGPAGSSCAWRLRQLGVECLLLDQQEFPRTKLCAGWITPQVVSDLEIDLSKYPHRLVTFDAIHAHVRCFTFRMRTVQHSIRRYEFDDWLLRRSGVPVARHMAREVRRDGEHYVIDGLYHCKHLVGAGGARCPVYRALFQEANPRAKELQVAALEQEFPYDYRDPRCHLWFYDKGLRGYAWYVPKGDGWLNVGIGGAASKLLERGGHIKTHWNALVAKLERFGLVRGYAFDPKGYGYHMRSDVVVGQIGRAYVVGDSAGLATRDLCEGIGPAVRSGILAAEAIASGKEYSLRTVQPYSVPNRLIRRGLEYLFIGRGTRQR